MNDHSTENKIKKDELHKKVDDDITHIIKHLSNIFDNIKFNDTQFIEETNNLELQSSCESIINRMEDMLGMVYELKADYLKKTEYDLSSKKELQAQHKNIMKDLGKNMAVLQENYNHISSTIRDMKSNKYYKYSLNYNYND
jgi:hypothetical protein